MTTLLFTLPLPPTGTNHAYHTSRGRWYKDQRIVDWENECLMLLLGGVQKIDYTSILVVNIGFYFGDKRKHDIDGRIKFVLDLFEKAGAYGNDSEVTDLIVSKRFDKADPRMQVEIYAGN